MKQSIIPALTLRLRKAQAVPGMEAADPEMAPEQHEIFAPGFGVFKKKSFKKHTLESIDRLREAVRLDNWHEAHNIAGVTDSMIQGMKNYMAGKGPVNMEEAGTPAGERMGEKGACSGKGGCSGKHMDEKKNDKKEDRKTAMNRAAIIRREDGKWVVRMHDGSKVLGTHDTKEKAEKQLQAIEISKHSKKAQLTLRRLQDEEAIEILKTAVDRPELVEFLVPGIATVESEEGEPSQWYTINLRIPKRDVTARELARDLDDHYENGPGEPFTRVSATMQDGGADWLVRITVHTGRDV